MKDQFSELIQDLELQLRTGQVARVRADLEKIKGTKIPRPYLVEFANIARRVRMDSWGLQILRPIIRPSAPLAEPPSVEEWAIYAGLLIKVGAVSEAMDILVNQAPSNNPRVDLYTAYAFISEWDYEKSIPLLKKYLQAAQEDPYQMAIAKVNLSSALVYMANFVEAQALLQELRQDCSKNNWSLLLSNCLEISAQLAVLTKDWKSADLLLSEAQAASNQHQDYILFIDKWRSLGNLIKNPKSEAALEALQKIRLQAVQSKSWETLRDCDYFQGLYCEHVNLLTHVFYGTPYVSYKNRILNVFKKNSWELSPTYIWRISAQPSQRVFDLSTATEISQGSDEPTAELKPGQLSHRILGLLSTDFYKPFFVGQLFSKIFPKEYFNPTSSPERIFQAIKKLRMWFGENKIPLEVQTEDGHYRLNPVGPYCFKLYQGENFSPLRVEIADQVYLGKLQSNWPYKTFSISQAALFLKLSPSTTRQIIKSGVAAGTIFLSGKGRSTLYRFTK